MSNNHCNNHNIIPLILIFSRISVNLIIGRIIRHIYKKYLEIKTNYPHPLNKLISINNLYRPLSSLAKPLPKDSIVIDKKRLIRRINLLWDILLNWEISIMLVVIRKLISLSVKQFIHQKETHLLTGTTQSINNPSSHKPQSHVPPCLDW